ncbi:MAG TPA: hypothetical protein VEA44_10630 [Caulobacter sp.]|nr:hypothetical protein [Caulobacter sp.]
MVAFEWTADLECEPSDLGPVVRVVHWRCTGREGGRDAAVYGSQRLGEPDPSNFLDAPDEITSEVIRAWVGDGAAAAEEAVTVQLSVIAERAAQQLLAAPVE